MAAASTPKQSSHRHRLAFSQSDVVTPKPDFAGMLSPALRKELDKFGLKVIPRRKAIPLLEHIYEQTHPVVEEAEQAEQGEEERSQDDASEGSDFSSDGEDFPEESMMHRFDDEEAGEGDNPAAPLAIQPTQTEKPLSEMVKEFIRGNPALHKQVLLYEPIWFESFVADFKVKTGLGKKCKADDVLDVLDAECITFRTTASTTRRRRTRKSPKKNSPKKQKRKAVATAGEKSPKRRKADQARAGM